MQVARSLPENIAKRFCLIAVGMEKDAVVIAIADPLDIVAMDTVRGKLKKQIIIKIGSEREIRNAIESIYHGSGAEEQRLRDLIQLETDFNEEEIDFSDDDLSVADISSEAAAGKAPVIRFVDLLLSQTIKSRASDLHIEPQENSMSIRMRVDGALREMVPPPRKMQPAVVTRIKILSKMDIAERRLPQDGRFKIKAGSYDIDVRVSTVPTIYGEKVVMRILDSASVKYDINGLGLEANLLKQFKSALSQPHGIVIVTGPTGSGKSTTLYSALSYLKDPRKNITTVEDPVEYRMRGVNQIQVKPEINLDFAKCLRAILRQDPDIVMIGEIRDKETVEIAIKASLTGHLVLSTFHTNDAPSAISRLIYMGIEPYLLASTLNLVVAQRLVKKICEHCKEPQALSPDLLSRLKIDPAEAGQLIFYHGKGCGQCEGTGYQGRLPIFEFLPVNTDLREKLVTGSSEAQIRAWARSKGNGGLLESGMKRLKEGVTTTEEVLGVTFAEDIL
jgi:type IV pilus assembly protein PilB